MILIELLAVCIAVPLMLIVVGAVWLWIGKAILCWIFVGS